MDTSTGRIDTLENFKPNERKNLVLLNDEQKRNLFRMTLKDLLTKFREKFPARNDCTSKVGKHDEYCQGCIEIIVEEPKDIESFLQENIEKMVREAKEKTTNELVGYILREMPKAVEGTIGEDSHKAIYKVAQQTYEFEIRKLLIKILTNKPDQITNHLGIK